MQKALFAATRRDTPIQLVRASCDPLSDGPWNFTCLEKLNSGTDLPSKCLESGPSVQHTSQEHPGQPLSRLQPGGCSS